MKKIISILLALVFFLSCFSAAAPAMAAAKLNFSASASEGRYVITWKYDSGATKYYVYIDGKLDGTKKATAAKSYSFTSDPYKAGEKHKIQLKAEKSGSIIATSERKTVLLSPLKPTLKYTTSGSNFIIRGTVSSGTVHGYALYRYNESKKGYDFVQNFTKDVTVKINSNTKKNTYKLKAYVEYDKKYYSAASSAVECTSKMTAVSLSSASSPKAGQITLKWKSVNYTDFTGYQICYTSYDSFGTNRKKTVAKAKTAYTLSLVAGVCYKLKMRTYRKIDKSTTYGAWSKTVTLYTKASVAKKVNVKELLNKQVKVYSAGKTGNEKLNKVLDKILNKIGCGAKSDYKTYDKVRLAYRYIATEQFKKDGDFKVKANSSGGTYAEQSTLRMIENKGSTGSCYEYNHLMHFLCIRMGLRNTYVVDGTVSSSGSGRTGHWWMMMKIGKNNYYYDPRMQRYMTATDINFFNLPMNGSNKYSDYFRFYDAQGELK